jgi:hypothetical protein
VQRQLCLTPARQATWTAGGHFDVFTPLQGADTDKSDDTPPNLKYE